MMYYREILLWSYLFGVLNTPFTWLTISFLRFGTFFAIISVNTFLMRLPSILTPLLSLMVLKFVPLELPRSSWSSIFPYYFSLLLIECLEHPYCLQVLISSLLTGLEVFISKISAWFFFITPISFQKWPFVFYFIFFILFCCLFTSSLNLLIILKFDSFSCLFLF